MKTRQSRSGWRSTTLGEVVNLRRGFDLPENSRTPGSYPVYSSSGITGNHNVPAEKGPGVITGRYGTIGKVLLSEGPYWPLNTTLYVDDFKGNNPQFIYYLLKTVPWQEYTTASAVPGINRNHLHQAFVHIPDLEVQEIIALFLRAIDNKIEINNRLNDYLEECIDALFKEKVLQNISEWSEASLLDIATYKNGLAMQKFRPADGDDGLPVLKIKELNQGYCAGDAERCSSNIDKSVQIKDGDLVFSWSGTLLLDFWAGGSAGLNQHLFKVTSDNYPVWFYYLWTKHHMRRFIALAADRATTMGHIKRSALEESKVYIPDDFALSQLELIFQPLVDEMIGRKVESRKFGALRDALLPKLMSGEIDVSKVDITQLNNHLDDC